MKHTVVVGVTSGIAAYKAIDFIKLLKGKGIEVRVIMTKNATKMVNASKFEKASGHKVYSELFETGFDYKTTLQSRKVDHIALADKADVLVIIPATANCIAKLAHGFADDFLTTTILAATCPIIVCPAMNVHMWHNPAVQENISTLKKRGYQIIKPASGMLACGYEGIGRLEDLQKIKAEIIKLLVCTTRLAGKKIIISAGGTQEKIDDVRYITNFSSGKMGVAIAEECYLQGADVLLFRAKKAVSPRYQIPEKTFTTAEELLELLKKNIKQYDAIYHVAAVSDFKPQSIKGKILSKKSFQLKLTRQIKILDQIKRINPNITLIAGKAEYGLSEKALIKAATKRLRESHADAIIANDISKSDSGFESDMNEVIIITVNGIIQKIPHDTKQNIAKKIVAFVSDFGNS